MTSRRVLSTFLAVVVLASAGGRVLAAQAAKTPAAAAAKTPAAQTASQFYLAYRAAFDKATKVDDIKAFQSKSVRAQVEATPAAERAEMFKMLKEFGAVTNVKIVKETATATGATLSVEAIDSAKAKTTGEVKLVKEDGAWKLDKESWK